MLPVRDQDAALEFWTKRVGFELASDETFGDEHWIELRDRGVEFATPPVRMHFGWWAMFADQDGIRYALGQSD